MNRFKLASFLVGAVIPAACAPPPRATPVPPPAAPAVTSAAAASVVAPTPPPAALLLDEGPFEETFAPGDRVARLRALEPQLRALITAEAKRIETPGLAVGIVLDGKLAFTQFEGSADPATNRPLDADAAFRIGSISKTFTASALVKLRDEGKLSLDEPVERYLPELARLKYPTSDSRRLTLRQILTHTSGLPRTGHFEYIAPSHDPTEAEVLESGDVALSHVPGTHYMYSNLAMAFAGITVSRVSGTPLREYLRSQLLAPLGMNATVWSEADVPAAHRVVGFSSTASDRKAETPWRLGASEGAGGLYSSLADMSRWVAFQLDAYPPRNGADEGPLRRASRRDLHATHEETDLTILPAGGEHGPSLVDVYDGSVGLAFHRENTCFASGAIKHSGAIDGFQTTMSFLPKRGFGVIALSSLVTESVDPLGRKLVRMLASNGFEERARRGPISPQLSQALTTLLTLQNEAATKWDETAYRATLTAAHAKSVREGQERRELMGYHARHGKCRPGEVQKLDTPHSATFQLSCERGRLEMHVSIDAAGKISGFSGHSFGVEPTKTQRRAAERVAALFTKFDPKAFHTYLGKAFPDEAGERAWFARKAESYGACRLGRSLDEQDDAGNVAFSLICERGGEMRLTTRLAEGQSDEIAAFRVRSAQEGQCPAAATKPVAGKK